MSSFIQQDKRTTLMSLNRRIPWQCICISPDCVVYFTHTLFQGPFEIGNMILGFEGVTEVMLALAQSDRTLHQVQYPYLCFTILKQITFSKFSDSN